MPDAQKISTKAAELVSLLVSRYLAYGVVIGVSRGTQDALANKAEWSLTQLEAYIAELEAHRA